MAFPSNIFVLILLCSSTITESANPYGLQRVTDSGEDYGEDDYEELGPKRDVFPVASSGRVKIQVFRGPTRSAEGEEEEWAPWGFYVSQPVGYGVGFHGAAHGNDT